MDEQEILDIQSRRAIKERQEQIDALKVERDVLVALLSEYDKPFKDISKGERFDFVKRHRYDWPLLPMLHVLEVSRSGFYRRQHKEREQEFLPDE